MTTAATTALRACKALTPAEGQSNAGIAKALWITHGAVEKHIKHIFSKLGVHSACHYARDVPLSQD